MRAFTSAEGTRCNPSLEEPIVHPRHGGSDGEWVAFVQQSGSGCYLIKSSFLYSLI